VLAALGAAGWLATDGVAVVERPSRRPVVVPEGWRTGWERAFGDTLVYFCRR
jgi:16S rRNA G966 N2-methylase RsmD